MPSLQPYNLPLGKRKAKHLLRRATFTYKKSQIDDFSLLTPSEAVTQLINNPTDIITEPYDPKPTDNPDGYWTSSIVPVGGFNGQGRKRVYTCAWWWYNAVKQLSFKAKMSFFLHTSFTVEKAGVNSLQFFDYLRLLNFYALGNIKDMARKITLDNAMLIYLDNNDNNKNNPNENYAREFLELFTILKGEQIGEGNYTNYTEIDIQEAARVLTGFKKETTRQTIDSDTNIPKGYARLDKHDTNDKIFSSAFNNQTIAGRDTEAGMYEEYDEFVDMIFAQTETAKAYCRKLYRFFVKRDISAEVETDIIEPLANILRNNNYEIIPVLEALFKSEHFYDEDDFDNTDHTIGAQIKSPLQMVSEIYTLFEDSLSTPQPTEPANLYNYYERFFKRFIHDDFLTGAGMVLFSPDSVAGYPALYQLPNYDRQWFTSATIVARYKLVQSLILGNSTLGGGNIQGSFDSVNFVENNIGTPNSVSSLVTELADLLYPEEITDERRDYFINIVLDGQASYYWNGLWNDYINSGDDTNVKIRLDELFIAMTNAAEFQTF